MEYVIEEMGRRLALGQTFALAIVTESEGSTPRKVGSKMLVFEDGGIYATIGGGSPEAAAIQACREALESGVSRELAYDLTQGDVDVSAPICGGAGSVMICVIGPSQLPAAEALASGKAMNRDMQLIVRIADGTADLFALDAASGAATAPQGIAGDDALSARLALLCQQHHDVDARTVDEDGAIWYSERIRPEGTLYLLGGGHVSFATEEVARIAGFATAVVDDREEFANAGRFPYARCIVLPEFAGLDGLDIIEDDYIVIATRGHSYDRACLDWALTTPARYIGMIGSKRKVRLVLDRLLEEGAPKEKVDAVHSPIGLPIGGNTPGEIAVSIVAELIQERVSRYGE